MHDAPQGRGYNIYEIGLSNKRTAFRKMWGASANGICLDAF